MEKMNIWAGLKFIRIAEGKFIFGSLGNNEYAWDDEKPQHSIDIPYEYWVGKYPISVSDFGEFTRATSYLTRAEMEGWCWVWNVDEMKWEKSFSESQDALEMLANKALEQARQGKAEEIGWDEC